MGVNYLAGMAQVNVKMKMKLHLPLNIQCTKHSISMGKFSHTTRPSTRPGVRGTVMPSGKTKGLSPMSLMKLLIHTSNPAQGMMFQHKALKS